MSNMTAMEWLIKELRLRKLEDMERDNGEFFLTETLESALAREAEQRDSDYQRGLQECTEEYEAEQGNTIDDLPNLN
jgi:hypothetical protein